MLYRVNPPVFSLRREIDRLFDDAFGAGGTGDSRRASWLPAVDVEENTDEYRFDVELPGISPDEVDVTADNGVLTIRGEKSQRATREGEEGRVHFVERSYGSFTRSFQLPQGVDEEGINASFENGLLSVRVPKAARPQPRKIEIGGGQRRVESGTRAGAARSAAGGASDSSTSSESAKEGAGARK